MEYLFAAIVLVLVVIIAWYVLLPVYAVIAACVVLILLGNEVFKPTATVRYQLTIAVDVEGKPMAASSNIEIYYTRGGGGHGGAPGLFGFGRGVAPVVNMGDSGMLIVPLQPYMGDDSVHLQGYKRRSKSRRRTREWDCQLSTTDLLEEAFDLGKFGNPDERYGRNRGAFMSALSKLRGKRVLNDDVALIWFPKDGNYNEGKYLCPEKLSEAIGKDIRLREITLEIMPTAAIGRELAIQAPWLDQIRAGHRRGTFDRRATFVPGLLQLERDHWASH